MCNTKSQLPTSSASSIRRTYIVYCLPNQNDAPHDIMSALTKQRAETDGGTPRGLIEKECVAKSRYSGLPSNRSAEGLPPPSIGYQKNGSLYVWGRMADDLEVSALNTSNIGETKYGGATGKLGFRKLAFLFGALTLKDNSVECQLAESAQFSLSFDSADTLKAETVKKSVEATHK